MKPAFNPKRVETKQPKGPGTKNVLPFYKAIGNAKRVAYRVDVGEYVEELETGRVVLEFDASKRLVGVEIIG